MRTPVLLIGILLIASAQAQVAVRSYYDTFTNAGPLSERTTLLANGDALYYDQGWNGLARLAPDGSVVWYKRFAIDPDPLAFTAIAHAAEQDNGNLAVAIVQRDPGLDYAPGLMVLSAVGNVLNAHVASDVSMEVLDWLRVFVAPPGGDLLMTLRDAGSNGSIHRFDAVGSHVLSETYPSAGNVPVEGVMAPSLIGATVGGLQEFAPGGWALVPNITPIGGVNYTAFIWDVAPVPGGFAFAFVRTGGPELMMPGIGLVDQNGTFQNAIVFEIDALMGMTNLFDRPRLASTVNGLALACNNGSQNDPAGWLMTCAHDLSNAQVLRVDLGDESYARSVSAWSGDLVLTGYVDQFGVGERLIARTSNGLDMSDCFPAEPFTVQPFPMQTLAFTPPAGTAATTTWTAVTPTVTDATFNSDFLCGVQSVEGPALASFTLLPNPATGSVHVQGIPSGSSTVELVDPLGRSVLHRAFTGTELVLDVNALSRGVYTVHVHTGQGRGSRLLVLE